MFQNNLSYLNLIYKLIAFLLIIVTAITAWVYLAPLSSAVVKNGNITHSKSTQVITAQISANIKTLFISNYQHVQKGQPLIVFDNKTSQSRFAFLIFKLFSCLDALPNMFSIFIINLNFLIFLVVLVNLNSQSFHQKFLLP